MWTQTFVMHKIQSPFICQEIRAWQFLPACLNSWTSLMIPWPFHLRWKSTLLRKKEKKGDDLWRQIRGRWHPSHPSCTQEQYQSPVAILILFSTAFFHPLGDSSDSQKCLHKAACPRILRYFLKVATKFKPELSTELGNYSLSFSSWGGDTACSCQKIRENSCWSWKWSLSILSVL